MENTHKELKVKINRWLKDAGLKAMIEGLITAARAKRLPIRNCQQT